jgi:hypothetical protein
MPKHPSHLLLLCRKLASAAESFCCFVELNIGILECDTAIIYKMIRAELNLLEDMAFFSMPVKPNISIETYEAANKMSGQQEQRGDPAS